MNKKAGTWLFVLIILLLIGTFIWGTYNKLVKRQEAVKMEWGQVENQYQRRADLIPNLVKTVEGYAAHERETLQAVIEARAKATQTIVDIENASPAQWAKYAQMQGELTQALGKLLAVIEQYPDLKANENFIMLQAQLEGTENRIAITRQRFIESVNAYNRYRRKFPVIMVAPLFNFDRIEYFTADENSENVPKVEFNRTKNQTQQETQ